MVGDQKLKDLVVVSYYDVKPYYFMTLGQKSNG